MRMRGMLKVTQDNTGWERGTHHQVQQGKTSGSHSPKSCPQWEPACPDRMKPCCLLFSPWNPPGPAQLNTSLYVSVATVISCDEIETQMEKGKAKEKFIIGRSCLTSVQTRAKYFFLTLWCVVIWIDFFLCQTRDNVCPRKFERPFLLDNTNQHGRERSLHSWKREGRDNPGRVQCL